MAIRKLLERGDAGLKQQNLVVPLADISSPEIKQVIRDLFATMHAVNLIAIAAPQIGENLQIFVTELRKTKLRSASETDQARVFINPEIIASSQETVVIYEGCGSVNGKEPIGPVVRPRSVTVSAWNESGEKFSLHCNGLLARAIQHEADHLQGKEFLDRMAPDAKLVSASYFDSKIKHLPEHKLASRTTVKELRLSTTP